MRKYAFVSATQYSIIQEILSLYATLECVGGSTSFETFWNLPPSVRRAILEYEPPTVELKKSTIVCNVVRFEIYQDKTNRESMILLAFTQTGRQEPMIECVGELLGYMFTPQPHPVTSTMIATARARSQERWSLAKVKDRTLRIAIRFIWIPLLVLPFLLTLGDKGYWVVSYNSTPDGFILHFSAFVLWVMALFIAVVWILAAGTIYLSEWRKFAKHRAWLRKEVHWAAK